MSHAKPPLLGLVWCWSSGCWPVGQLLTSLSGWASRGRRPTRCAIYRHVRRSGSGMSMLWIEARARPEARRHAVTERRYLEWVARLADIIFDCAQPSSLARWWASTRDGYRVAPYDTSELERLRDMGVFDPEDDPMVLVEPAVGEGPRYLFQRV